MWGASSVGCHLHSGATSAGMPPLLGCHLPLGVTSAQVPLLLRCHLCSGRCHLSLGATSAQMPPPAGYHLCPGTTSARVPPPPRYHLRTDATPRGGREQGQCPQHRGDCCDATGYHVALGQLVTPLKFPKHLPRHEHVSAGMGTQESRAEKQTAREQEENC